MLLLRSAKNFSADRFDIVANRLHGFENKDQLIRKAMQEKRRGPQKAKPTKWKQQSEAFRVGLGGCGRGVVWHLGCYCIVSIYGPL